MFRARQVHPTSCFHRTCFPFLRKYSRSKAWICNQDVDPQRKTLTSHSYSSLATETKVLPRHARAVICGGGIIGCSVAYHLSKFGFKDVVLLEQGSVNCGTTWHAAGLIGKLRTTSIESQLSDYGGKLYVNLEEETGHGTGFKQCGSLLLAKTKEREQYVKRLKARARLLNVKVEMISPKEALDLWPHMQIDDLKAALWLPEDAVATSSDLCQALAKGATMHGAKIFQKVIVDKVLTKNNSICGVETSQGAIDCEVFVNCGGMWARHIGLEKSNPQVHIPLHAAEHYYIVTKPIQGVDPMLPVLRDPDGCVYVREWSGGFLAGGFEPNAKPIFGKGVPKPFEYQLLPEDWDQFEPLMEGLLHRVPVMASTEIRQLLNGPESFTPDAHYILGESPQIRKYYVAAGMNSSGIASSGGAGKALAEWIINDKPTMDLSSLDIKRFSPHHNDLKFLHDRIAETLSFHYKLHFPLEEKNSSRNILCSPLHPILSEAGASWGQKMCWERPNWFAFSKDDPRHNIATFGTPNWSPNVEKEYDACVNDVGIVDMSSTTKFILESSDESSSLNHLQYLCACDIDVPPGSLVRTAMLDQDGKYAVECTVSRLATNRFLLITSSTQAVRLEHNLTHQIAEDWNTFLHDVTRWGCLSVIGPNAEPLLSSVFMSSNQVLEVMKGNTFKEMEFSPVCKVLLLKKSNKTGEDIRWQIICGWNETPLIYEKLMSLGSHHGIANVGCYALEALRVEKGYPKFGCELFPSTSPHEVGNALIDLEKTEDYIGKNSLLKNKNTSSKQMARLTVKEFNKENLPWGGEVVLHDGIVVGSTSSASFSYSMNKPTCIGFITLPSDKPLADGKFEIEIAGETYPVEIVI